MDTLVTWMRCRLCGVEWWIGEGEEANLEKGFVYYQPHPPSLCTTYLQQITCYSDEYTKFLEVCHGRDLPRRENLSH